MSTSNQTQKSAQTLLIIILVVLVIILIAGAAVIILMQGRIKQLENVAYSGDSAFLTKEVIATLPPTDLPAQPTYTPWITPTPQDTYTPEPPLPTNTPYPTNTSEPTKTPYRTPVFMFNVDEVLYLNSSISSGDLWNPDKPLPFVEEVDRINILALLQNAQWYREYVWRWEDYSDLWVYNDGYALTQLTNYYNYYIDPNDDCYVEIDVVGNQFHTIITAYDGVTAKTMTIKVESRNHICNNTSTKWIANDGYAYEMKVQKFSDGMGGYLWKIVEHPLGSDPSQ
jgi:hypothetical protein